VPTLVLTRAEVARVLDPPSLLPALRRAFIAHSSGATAKPLRVRSALPGPGTATVLFPGVAAGVPAYTVKVHAKFPAEAPAIRGVLCLHAADTGALLAVMDSTHLTAVRTGLAGALAADVLARPDADTVAVIGAGVQGRHQLGALAAMRAVRSVRVFDVDAGRAAAFARTMADELGVAVEAAGDAATALHDGAPAGAARRARPAARRAHAGVVARRRRGAESGRVRGAGRVGAARRGAPVTDVGHRRIGGAPADVAALQLAIDPA